MDLTDFTKYGQCSNCGQCCSDLLHLSKEEIKRIEDLLPTDSEKLLVKRS